LALPIAVGSVTSREVAKVAAGSAIGTTIEWFDFYISGAAAALAWPSVFFPNQNPFAGVLASFVLFGVGFVGRPIGALIFGHLGDRRGRRSTLTLTLILVGIGSLFIGLTPGFSSIGIGGGFLISAFRVLQGVGVGGEWGGASVWVTETAARSRLRVLWTAPLQLAVPFGLICSSGLYTVLTASLSQADFLAYGWRIPFLIGAAVTVVGVVLRRSALESPIFRSLSERKSIERAPSIKVIKARPGTMAKLAAAWGYQNAVFYVITTFAISYMVVGLSISRPFATSTVFYAALGSIIGILFGAFLGDRIGRKRTLLLSTISATIFPFFYFQMLNTHNPALIIAAQMIALFTLFGYAVLSAFFSEQFPASYRYSGASLSYHVAAPLSGGIAPIIAAAIVASYGLAAGWPWIALMLSGYAFVAMLATLTTHDTRLGVVTEDGVDQAEKEG
jgi:MFS family permease